MADAAAGRPIIDVASGSGRNAFYLAELQCSVVCVDRDLSRLRSRRLAGNIFERLTLVEMDLLVDRWPFESKTIGGIVLVDFLGRSLWEALGRSLGRGGCLLVETISGRGGNYLELPKAGELRTAFESSCDLEFYEERKVGPRDGNAVTVKMLGKRRH